MSPAQALHLIERHSIVCVDEVRTPGGRHKIHELACADFLAPDVEVASHRLNCAMA